jgi:hypothetical protein
MKNRPVIKAQQPSCSRKLSKRDYMGGEEETISKEVRRRELAGFLVELFEEWSHGRRGPSRVRAREASGN